MTQLKSVNIKGKQYVEVNERLIYFRNNYPNFSLTSQVLEKTDKSILILATITNADGKIISTGMAEEEKGSTFINKTSYVENCETSAWGRALANFGIGLDTSVASAEEVKNAIANQESTSTPSKKKLEVGDENWDKVIKWAVDNKDKGLNAIVKILQQRFTIPNVVKAELKKNI
jgi:hypothetical protein|tara:strand:+ start:302 stop:823 length:522 start_codon:yes stop_codon:yes gene_type:complete